jgi:two-component system NtrC family sensor kinase
MEQLADGGGVRRIRLYDAGGRIAQSTRADEIGSRVERHQQPCAGCHAAGARPAVVRTRQTDLVTEMGGRPVLRHLTVVWNEPSCASATCHPAAAVQRQLGVLDVEVSMDPLAVALATTRRRTLLDAGGAGGAGGRRVHRAHPPAGAAAGGRATAAPSASRGEMDGRLSRCAAGTSLAELAERFNRMAAEVKAAREEVTGWSRRLEEKVVGRATSCGARSARCCRWSAWPRWASWPPPWPTRSTTRSRHPGHRSPRAARAGGPTRCREAGGGVSQHLQLIAQECSRCGHRAQPAAVRAPLGGAMAPVDANEVAERSLMLMRHHLEMHTASR